MHPAGLFERGANNIPRFDPFQGDGYARLAADCRFELETPIKLYAIDPSKLTDSGDTSF